VPAIRKKIGGALPSEMLSGGMSPTETDTACDPFGDEVGNTELEATGPENTPPELAAVFAANAVC
jgi:hypothetical protein